LAAENSPGLLDRFRLIAYDIWACEKSFELLLRKFPFPTWARPAYFIHLTIDLNFAGRGISTNKLFQAENKPFPQ
jgi:hypothetical protein